MRFVDDDQIPLRCHQTFMANQIVTLHCLLIPPSTLAEGLEGVCGNNRLGEVEPRITLMIGQCSRHQTLIGVQIGRID